MRQKSIFLIAMVCLLTGGVCAQTGNQRKSDVSILNLYAGFGLGTCNPGLSSSVAGTFVLSNSWGASIRYNSNHLEAKNLPGDYVDLVLFIPFVANGFPRDNRFTLSFYALKEFPTSSEYVRFGLELGPAFVFSRVAEFTPDPAYIPFLGSNYTVSYQKDNSVGFSLRAKAEFPLSRYAGLELAGFTTINALRTLLGAEICINLGLVRK